MEQQFPIFKTKRLLLRNITKADLSNIYQGLSHPDVIRFYGISYESLEATKEQLRWYHNLRQTKTGIWWAICSLDDQIFYGAGGLNDMSLENKKAEIGLWLLPEYWGEGIMT